MCILEILVQLQSFQLELCNVMTQRYFRVEGYRPKNHVTRYTSHELVTDYQHFVACLYFFFLFFFKYYRFHKNAERLWKIFRQFSV